MFCTDTWFPTSWRLLGNDGTATHTLHVGTAAIWGANSWSTFSCGPLVPVITLQLQVTSWSGTGLSMGEVEFIRSPPPPPPPLFIPPVTPFNRFADANANDATENNLVDNAPGNYWNTALDPPPFAGTEIYLIDLIAPYPFVASQCRMYCAGSNNPRNFRLSGRTAAGGWQLLKTWSNETWPLSGGWRTFDFPEPPVPASYAVWRLQIDAYNGTGVSIGEFDFPHMYVRSSDPAVFEPGSLLRVEISVEQPGNPAENSRMQFLVGRRGDEP